MKIGILTKPNEKGQIVIPKEIRDRLDISKDTGLNILVGDTGFYVYPINQVFMRKNMGSSYLELLKRTQGAWGKETLVEKRRRLKQRKIELKASERRKNAW